MLKENLGKVQAEIEQALDNRKTAKITGNAVTLIAVTKNHSAEVTRNILKLGVQNVGENRVQEALSKKVLVNNLAKWHLIGHLQTNKSKQAVELFDLIESVDSERLLEALDKAARLQNKIQQILLQINIARESQKTGFLPEEYLDILSKLDNYKNLNIKGLMVIAPICEDINDTRPVFSAGYDYFCKLKELRPEVEFLSMGMTNDFTVAIEEGANMVRVGRALFGERDYSINKL